MGAFFLGFLLSLAPIITSPLLVPNVRMFEGRLYWVWGVELFVATLFLGIYRYAQAWKWALAVGAGLPSAILVRGCIDMVLYPGARTVFLSLSLFLVLTSIFAAFSVALGAVCGYLLKKTYENW